MTSQYSGDGVTSWADDTRFEAVPDVVVERIETEVVLLDLSRNEVFELNEVGGFVWERLAAREALSQIVGAVCEAFEAEREQVDLDVREIIGALLKAGLLRRV